MKNIDNVPAALEQAASLALQFTAAPRDYLGPATPAMKEQASLGERLAAAIRALRVTAAPAAAPKVAADERALQAAIQRVRAHEQQIGASVNGDISIGLHYAVNALGLAVDALERAVPVQAQVPVACVLTPAEIEEIDDEVLKKGMRGADGKRQGYCVLFAQAVIAANNAKCAPAQPVAAPDGWKWMPIKATGAMADAGAFSGLPVGAAEPWIAKQVWEAMAAQSPAAPAAQGDAKELTDERIYDIAALCEIGIGHNDHETSQRFEFARAILAAIAAKAAS
jgi:hypothetical protein